MNFGKKRLRKIEISWTGRVLDWNENVLCVKWKLIPDTVKGEIVHIPSYARTLPEVLSSATHSLCPWEMKQCSSPASVTFETGSTCSIAVASVKWKRVMDWVPKLGCDPPWRCWLPLLLLLQRALCTLEDLKALRAIACRIWKVLLGNTGHSWKPWGDKCKEGKGLCCSLGSPKDSRGRANITTFTWRDFSKIYCEWTRKRSTSIKAVL